MFEKMKMDDDQILDDERKYIEINVDNSRISDDDLAVVFGHNRLQEMRRSLPLKRHIAALRIERVLQKSLSGKLEHERMLKLQPHAIKALVDILNGTDAKLKLGAARFILGPSMKGLEVASAITGQAEAFESSNSVKDFHQRADKKDDGTAFPPLKYNLHDL